MPRFRLLALLLLIALSVTAYAADRVTCMTTWDEFYLYAAIQVQDPVVESTNVKHMSNPWEDDDIEIFLETDAARAADRSPSTFQMAVSAGGGSNWLVGENGKATPRTIFTFKLAKKVDGTLNKQSDKDIGYTIELAIPWKEVGGAPEPGRIMGFNLICRMRGENTGFVSLSPEVKTEDDVQVPAKWSKIKFVASPTIVAIQDGAIVSRKVISRAPVIDGVISPREWNTDLSFQLVRPPSIPLPPEKQKYMMERLSLTPYLYSYQADDRKEGGASGLLGSCGIGTGLVDQPIKGVGPWFSYDQVQSHKDELADIRDANIDVVLPFYRSSDPGAAKGLDCMVQALKELKSEGKDYPLVGMFLDTMSVASPYHTTPDLKSDEVKQTFYGIIKGFFLHVPDEFRAAFQLPPEKGGGAANILVLGTAGWFERSRWRLRRVLQQAFCGGLREQACLDRLVELPSEGRCPGRLLRQRRGHGPQVRRHRLDRHRGRRSGLRRLPPVPPCQQAQHPQPHGWRRLPRRLGCARAEVAELADRR